jgi:hypothetical protein
MERDTVPKAAQLLGISEGAIRTRLSRGTLESVRDGERVYVLLEHDTTQTQHDETSDMPQSEPNALISAKDDLIATLREQLEAERRANDENRRLLAAALERIPQITGEPSTEPQDAPQEQTDTTTPPEGTGQPRRWWEFWRWCISIQHHNILWKPTMRKELL